MYIVGNQTVLDVFAVLSGIFQKRKSIAMTFVMICSVTSSYMWPKQTNTQSSALLNFLKDVIRVSPHK